MDDTAHHTAQKICQSHNSRLNKIGQICKHIIFNKVDRKYIMDDTAHHTAQKICHAHNPTSDKLDKFVKMSFSTEWTRNISWMILRTALHRKYVTLITLDWTNL